jgi:hypothetical protein
VGAGRCRKWVAAWAVLRAACALAAERIARATPELTLGLRSTTGTPACRFWDVALTLGIDRQESLSYCRRFIAVGAWAALGLRMRTRIEDEPTAVPLTCLPFFYATLNDHFMSCTTT